MNALFMAETPTEEKTASPCAGLSGIEHGECKAILRALTEARGNKSEVARRLGISRPTLNKKCKQYGLDLLDFS